ncbi:hypothetical protein [Sedimentimonas flavescens]|uniref:hypothetical protein n=1 Tax=Sedimentimonas flavescens TaxID=2851012 RepID=UPI001C4A5985|nr:hypothetical protein [Sedimentimonas flavescens]MBW0159568.1 hypothetical protein [Sedimentimonas flavescens]MCT2538959.1 hypothetical protein [Sedimentimonas flavescens]
MFRKSLCTSLLALATSIAAAPAIAQDGAGISDVQRELAEVNNGTNPTLLTTQAGIQYQYSEINSDVNTGLLEAFYLKPIGDGDKAFRFTVPFSRNSLLSDGDLKFGDLSVTFIDVFHLSATSGAAYTVELFLDTAESDSSGYGQFVMETSLFYAWFLSDGSIFAPAWVQTFGLEGGNDNGDNVNTTTVDFYYVPKLANPKYYLTFDPAIIHDWENERTFGSLQVTAGMLTGKAFGGDSQIFVKPGILFGGDAPADWSVQVGYKVLNF